MPHYARGDASIYYEESGTGYPLLLLAPGGMNSVIEFWGRMPLNPLAALAQDFHLIAMDQRNAGRSSGPVDSHDPWGMYVADQVGLLDHLGISRALLMGACIGCSFILKFGADYPDRCVAGVLAQPVGVDHTNPGHFGPSSWTPWAESLVGKRADLAMEDVEAFCNALWSGEFVLSVSREAIAGITNPLLVMPGRDSAHPTGVGLELARLLPNAQLLEQWKAPAEIVPRTIEHVRQFLKAHEPAGAE